LDSYKVEKHVPEKQSKTPSLQRNGREVGICKEAKRSSETNTLHNKSLSGKRFQQLFPPAYLDPTRDPMHQPIEDDSASTVTACRQPHTLK
jgi:hypothetical protein